MENEEIRKSSENILPIFSKIHNVVKKDIATPSRLISLIQLYFRLYEENLNILRDRQHKLKVVDTNHRSFQIFNFHSLSQ